MNKRIALLLTFVLLTTFALAEPRLPQQKPTGKLANPVKTESSSSKVYVVVELQDDSISKAYTKAMAGKTSNRALANASAQTQASKIAKAQNDFLGKLSASKLNAKIIYRASKVYNGVAVKVGRSQLAELRKLPGVKAIRTIDLKTPQLFNSVPFQNVPAAWTTWTATGSGISIGVIDTGVDYVHANFGGDEDYTNDTTIAGDNPNFPSAKVVGGTDFAGDDYNASDDNNDTPAPDPDPMDCNGHGSHVAGIATGLGVTDTGNTYGGAYDATTHSNPFRIGPGVAPGADLYALRVFGCAGSTAVTDLAIEWAMDPNGDLDFSDHLDIINMSLGSNFGSPDDASTVAAEAAANVGVIVVASAGNAGDTYYISGSPGTSVQTITVANSVDGYSVIGGLLINAPVAIQNSYAATEAVFGPDLLTFGDVTADVVRGDDGSTAGGGTINDGCQPLINGGAVANKIAIIDRGVCTFKAKVLNAQNAGAIGVIIANNQAGFPITMGDDPLTPAAITIPSQMVGQADGNLIKTTMLTNTVNATLTASLRNSVQSFQAAVADTINASSSRGPRRGGSFLKPDITAVGDSVFSTQTGSGDGGLNIGGTSMAAPHIAGAAALIREEHPSLTIEEVKALLMSTSTNNIFTGLNLTGNRYGNGRIGSGRLNMANVVDPDATVLAYNDEDDGAVSVSFGEIEIVNTVANPDFTDVKTVRLRNLSGVAAAYNVSYLASNSVSATQTTDLPGVTFTFPPTVNVAANDTSTFDITLNVEASALRHPRDGTVANAQATNLGTDVRNWISEETGYVILTPTAPVGAPTIRVPVYVSARAASDLATEASVTFDQPNGVVNLTPTGTDVVRAAGNNADDYSLVSALLLQEISPDDGGITDTAENADLKHIGVTSQGNLVTFGFSTYGEWSTLNEVTFRVYIDTDQDGTDDWFVQNIDLGRAGGGGATDTFYTLVCEPDGTNCFLGEWVNIFSPAANFVNPQVYNTNVVTLSFDANTTIGAFTGPFDYRVVTFSRDFDGQADESATHTFDPTNPGISLDSENFPGVHMDGDFNGDPLDINYDTLAFQENNGLGILLFHHHNVMGAREQIVDVDLESDLVVDVVDNQDPIFLGNYETYTVSVTNNGPANATGVVLTDVLDGNTTFFSANDPGCLEAAGTVTCTVGDLNVGDTYSVQITALVNAGPTLTNTGSAVSDNADPTPADATDIETTTVNDAGLSTTFAIDKTDNPDPVLNGQNLEYTISVQNTGTEDAPFVVITDTLPSSVTIVDVTPSVGVCSTAGNLVTCNVGNLVAGDGIASVVINVTPTVSGPISNTATVSAAINLTGTPADIEATTVVASADLEITKVADANPHLPGQVTYTVTVTNHGPDEAVDAQFTDTLPPNGQFVSVAPACTSMPNVDDFGGTIVCEVGFLAAGESVVYTIVQLQERAGGYINNAFAISLTSDPDPSNNTVEFLGVVLPEQPAAPTGCTATETFVKSTATPIISSGTTQSVITVSTPDTYLWDLNLVTFIDYIDSLWLTITLTSPSGREVTIRTADNNGVGNYFGNTAWDDQANNPVTDFDFSSAATPLTVEEALSAFRGEDPNGDWTLTIVDNSGEFGMVAWMLHLTTLAEEPEVAGLGFANNNTSDLQPLGMFTSTIEVTGVGAIADVDMVLNLTHFDTTENTILLTSPSGTTVTLSSNNGTQNGFQGTLFDDNAGDAELHSGPVTSAPFSFGFTTTPVTPESAMGAFMGEDGNGTWTLTIIDTEIDTDEILWTLLYPNRLNNWSLTVLSASCNEADLVLEKTDDEDPVQEGDGIEYTLNVTNLGPDDATHVQIADTLPNGVTFVNASPECSHNDGNVTCNIETIPVGQSVEITIQVDTNLSGDLTNVACVFGFDADPDGANNCENETTTVQLTPPIETDLSISKNDSADPTNVGGSITYTVTVTNNGPDDSDGFTVTDTLPAEVTFDSASPECSEAAGTVTCVHPGPLADGASINFLINVTADAEATASNSACVAADDIDENNSNDCDSEDTEIEAAPTNNSDLSISKVDSPDPVQVNDSLHYELTVTNNGPDPVTNIVVIDTLHASTTFVTASAGCSNNAGIVTCTAAGPLANAATVVFDIYVVPTLAGPIPNTACVTGLGVDGTPGNNCETEITNVTLTPPGFTDLSLVKSDSPDPVISTSTITYLLTVTNNGPDESTGFTITDTLSADTSFASASAGCTHDGALTGGVVTCVFNGNIANGDSTSIMISATAGSVLVQTVATNDACVVADNSDTVAANNCDSEDTTIDPVPPTSNADLAIVKSDSFDPLQVGSLLTYVLEVTNNGLDDATQITVVDTLHPSTTFQSASAGCLYDPNTHTVECSIASLTNGASAQLQIQVGTTLAGTVTNSACVAADFNNDANNANDCDSEDTTITITPPVLTGLSLTKNASASSVLTGNNITYTIGVFNDGPNVSTGHTVSDTLPVEVQFVSASAGCIHNGVNPGGVVTCQFGPLANNSSTSYTIVVKVVSGASALNEACVIADNFDLNPADDCDDALTTITATSVDLSLVKTGSPTSTTVGGTVDYTLTITNNGPGASTGSTLVDTLPGEVNFLSASPGCVHIAGVVTCNIGALTNGNSTAVTIQVEVVATGTLLNTATVTGNDADPNSANNTDTESTTASQCVFCDDFEDSTLQPAGVWTYTPSTTGWSEDGDNLVAQSSGKVFAAAKPIFAGCQLCTFETQMSTSGGSGNTIWFMPWHVSTANTMELLMKQEKGKWILKQRVGNVVVRKKAFKSPINVGQFYNVKITFNGSTFLVDIGATTSAITLVPAGVVPTGTVAYRVKGTTGRIAFINVN